jgi:hypothetical protein
MLFAPPSQPDPRANPTKRLADPSKMARQPHKKDSRPPKKGTPLTARHEEIEKNEKRAQKTNKIERSSCKKYEKDVGN